jgi:hypothetical protein
MVCSPETAPIRELGNEPAEDCGSLVSRRGEAMDAANKKAARMRAAFFEWLQGQDLNPGPLGHESIFESELL